MTSNHEVAANIVLSPRTRGRTVKQIYGWGQDVVQLVEAHAQGRGTRETVADLIRGGGAHLLVGQTEGDWLDAKTVAYDLNQLEGRISLSEAVAKFCNGQFGGVVVVGAATKSIPGGEATKAVRGVPVKAGLPARYLSILDRHLYPPVIGIRVDVVPTSNGLSLIVIDIPVQNEELKPFLVHGAIRRDGKTEGAYISIVQRRGETSIPVTAPMIHATLAAGRALLRGSGA